MPQGDNLAGFVVIRRSSLHSLTQLRCRHQLVAQCLTPCTLATLQQLTLNPRTLQARQQLEAELGEPDSRFRDLQGIQVHIKSKVGAINPAAGKVRLSAGSGLGVLS